MKYRLVSFKEEIAACINLAKIVPANIDIVCGIPRHGMIPASIISEYLGKPLMTPDNDTVWFSARSPRKEYNNPISILMVDDSLSTWNTMKTAQAKIQVIYPGAEMIIAAPYINEIDIPNIKYHIDYFKTGSHPMFHSQLMHDPWLRPMGIDMDGILCEDWSIDWDYNEFIENTKPYRIPTYNIDFIITGRLEKYRSQTEAWLKRYKVSYDKLIMLPEVEDHGVYKARICRENNIQIYIESSRDQADYINANSNAITICYDSGELFQKSN